jgi:hypothetical protein
MLAALPPFIRLACLGVLCTTALHARTWTDTQGRTLEADFVSATPTEINVRRADVRTLSLSRAKLSSEDLAYVDQQASAPEPAPLPAPSATPQRSEKPAAALPPKAEAGTGVDFNAFNTLLGMPLLADETLWDDSPADVARRLKLAVEGKNAHYEGFRAYPHPGREVLGAQALMISLQAAEGRVTSILLQFANRGDFPGFQHCVNDRSQPTAAELKAFEKTLKSDFTALTTGLTAKLGEPKRERALFGGLDSGRLSLRWECHGLALLVSQDPGQMVLLKIVPAGKAATARLGDDQVRRLLKERVARRAGGDVVIDQLPMVDQGPKGYCVPATFERYLRYAGITADMYELAACGGNDFGGGTSFHAMVQGVANYVSRQGRGLERVSIPLNVGAVARFIDEGRPIIWGLCSTEGYNTMVNENSAARKNAGDPAKWKPTPTAREIEKLYADPTTAHACLIIGYNRATKEIAVSDSWGPRFQERWIPAAAAQKVSQDEYWVLAW